MSPGDDGSMLDAERIAELLRELGQRLAARGLDARMFLVGGAAMALAFARDRVTRDLDAVFEPKAEVYAVAAEMAREHRLPDGWLNDAVKGLLPTLAPPMEGYGTFTSEGIHVGVAAPEYLFAMKAQAARVETDGEDLRRLGEILDITSAAQALDLVEQFYGADRLRPVTHLLLEELFD